MIVRRSKRAQVIRVNIWREFPLGTKSVARKTIFGFYVRRGKYREKPPRKSAVNGSYPKLILSVVAILLVTTKKWLK